MNTSEQLRILSIFHYVVGGLHALFGCFGLIHLSLGIAFMANPQMVKMEPTEIPPFWFGAIFALVGGIFVFFRVDSWFSYSAIWKIHI